MFTATCHHEHGCTALKAAFEPVCFGADGFKHGLWWVLLLHLTHLQQNLNIETVNIQYCIVSILTCRDPTADTWLTFTKEMDPNTKYRDLQYNSGSHHMVFMSQLVLKVLRRMKCFHIYRSTTTRLHLQRYQWINPSYFKLIQTYKKHIRYQWFCFFHM